jgi:hypothetical protein
LPSYERQKAAIIEYFDLFRSQKNIRMLNYYTQDLTLLYGIKCWAMTEKDQIGWSVGKMLQACIREVLGSSGGWDTA